MYGNKKLDAVINMRIDKEMLDDFKSLCGGKKYQTTIRILMEKYIEDMKKEEAKRVRKDNSIATDFLTK